MVTREQANAACDVLKAYVNGETSPGQTPTPGPGPTPGPTPGPVPEGVTVIDVSLNQREPLRIPLVAGQTLALHISAHRPTDGVNLVHIVGRGADSGDKKYRFALSTEAGNFDNPIAGQAGTGQVDVHFAIKPGASPSPWYQSIDQGDYYLNVQADAVAEGMQADLLFNVQYPPGGL